MTHHTRSLHYTRSLLEAIRNSKSSDLDQGFGVLGPDSERFDASHVGDACRRRGAAWGAGGRIVKMNIQHVFTAIPPEDVLSGGKGDIPDLNRDLGYQVVRVLAVRRVARGDQNHSGKELPVAVGHP